MSMTIGESIVYGLVQGLGEFLPISSSAHLTLLPWVAKRLGASGWDDPGLAVDVALHVGTLVALVVYFRDDLARYARAFVASLRERAIGADLDRRLAWLVVLGSVPGALIGAALQHKAETLFRAPWLIASAMLVLGLVLYAADRLAHDRPLTSLTARDALYIGLAQAGAIIPGVSRSGSTITAARFLGLDREAAARFSFLLSLPIIAGAAVLELVVKHEQFAAAGGLTPPVFVAVAVAGLSGYVVIGLLLRFVRTRSYLPFVVYRVLFGLSVLALAFA